MGAQPGHHTSPIPFKQVLWSGYDHYLQPIVAAALFGTIAVLRDDYGITLSLGDMSSSNGGFDHHVGHGHLSRSGLDVDFKYLNHNGVGFQSGTATTDSQFSSSNNQAVYDVAERFGFTSNYQGTRRNLVGVSTARDHNDCQQADSFDPPCLLFTDIGGSFVLKDQSFVGCVAGIRRNFEEVASSKTRISFSITSHPPCRMVRLSKGFDSKRQSESI